MSEDAPEPLPPLHFGFGGALMFSAAAWFASLFMASLFFGWASPPTALAIGAVAGFGGIGTLLARRLSPPVEARIGLRGFALRWLPVLLLLAPAAVLASEIDNWVKALAPVVETAGEAAPSPDAEAAATTALSPWLIFEAVIAMVLLRPVVEEFFFRGVLLQGLVARHGATLGVLATALLSALSDAAFALPLGTTLAISALAQGLCVGALLGAVRLASGSLLAAIALLALLRGFGGLAVVFVDAYPIPGFNAPGDHTPAGFLLPAMLSVALGVLLVARMSGAVPEPVDEPEQEADTS